ncbi:hypothetical protein [Ruania zhangjianzhongii]|uniref:hypothetical protein n=1 Tax=Ruania zhangjianzhongii TaxID=2603206 RepID=UPI001AEFC04B|nr:hypothetical protein [Ruania zhangjianzhongii]
MPSPRAESRRRRRRSIRWPDTVPGTPRWAVLAAYAVPLCILPSALWRTVGALDGSLSVDGTPLWYVLMLSALSVGLGLLTLGLVHSWGERVPSWVPRLGGRRVPARAAVLPAGIGALLLAGIIAVAIYRWNTFAAIDPDSPLTWMSDRDLMTDLRPLSQREEAGIVLWTYAPMIAWPVLLAAVTWAYRWRRTGGSPMVKG